MEDNDEIVVARLLREMRREVRAESYAAARREGVIEGLTFAIEAMKSGGIRAVRAEIERLGAALARADAPVPGCSSCGAMEPHAVDGCCPS